jgi:hypothetical protein
MRGFALLSLAWSIALAVWCSINRLYNFHASAQASRRRASNGKAAAEAQLEIRVVGEATWLLFRLQLVLFGICAATSAVALLPAHSRSGSVQNGNCSVEFSLDIGRPIVLLNRAGFPGDLLA